MEMEKQHKYIYIYIYHYIPPPPHTTMYPPWWHGLTATPSPNPVHGINTPNFVTDDKILAIWFFDASRSQSWSKPVKYYYIQCSTAVIQYKTLTIQYDTTQHNVTTCHHMIHGNAIWIVTLECNAKWCEIIWYYTILFEKIPFKIPYSLTNQIVEYHRMESKRI